MRLPMPSDNVMRSLKKGVAIPALPLALDKDKRLDEKYQAALFQYYFHSGAGGVAVGVHTTQFEIREPEYKLFEPVLQLGADVMAKLSEKRESPFIRIAGICGKTFQAVKEAEFASSLGYDIGLLSLGALREADEDELIRHCEEAAKIIPLMGFYLQPKVGGRKLSHAFWRRFFEIENVVAVKMAPFNRYMTLDVVRALALSGREKEITLYTGNDDNIVVDLLTPYRIETPAGEKLIRIRGGLLGQWSVWTEKAVEMLREIHVIIDDKQEIPQELLAKAVALTDANAAIFDAANDFAGCISGINEILRLQGLLEYSHCLSETERLSPGQAAEIQRVRREYPFLTDDDFVREHLSEWLEGGL